MYTIEKTIEAQIAVYLGFSKNEDMRELKANIKTLEVALPKKMEEQTNRINDRIEKLIYFVIGQFVALVSIMFAIARLV